MTCCLFCLVARCSLQFILMVGKIWEQCKSVCGTKKLHRDVWKCQKATWFVRSDGAVLWRVRCWSLAASRDGEIWLVQSFSLACNSLMALLTGHWDLNRLFIDSDDNSQSGWLSLAGFTWNSLLKCEFSGEQSTFKMAASARPLERSQTSRLFFALRNSLGNQFICFLAKT